MDNTTIAKAVYEAKREQLILAVKNPATTDFIDLAYAYAYLERLCPFWHVGEDDPFDTAYSIGREFCMEVLKFIDDFVVTGKEGPNFNEIESKFGGYKVNRIELVRIIRYIYLCDRYEDSTFNSILRNAPAEAHSINMPITQDNFYIP